MVKKDHRQKLISLTNLKIKELFGYPHDVWCNFIQAIN